MERSLRKDHFSLTQSYSLRTTRDLPIIQKPSMMCTSETTRSMSDWAVPSGLETTTIGVYMGIDLNTAL